MHRCYTFRAAVLLFLGTIGIAPLWAQQQDQVTVAVDAVSMRPADDKGRSQLDLYTQIPYSKLNFVSGPLGFTARYQVSAEISALDERGRPTFIMQSPIWDRSITVPVFAQTESTAQHDITTHSLQLDPGKYLVSFQVADRNAGETLFRELSVEVRDLDRPLAVSGIVLLDSYDHESKTIYPRVSSVLSGNALSFEVYFEMYTDLPRTVTMIRDLVPIRRNIRGYGNAGLGRESKAVFSDTSEVEVRGGRHQMVSLFPMSDLGVGSYRVRVRVQDGDYSDVSERVVVSRWTGLAVHLSDLDLAIEQMVYAASRRELQGIRSGATEAQRRRLFDEFWQKRDPTPQTERNELMEEYFYRVNVATQRFTSVRPGWQTDRGHVLIVHGSPEDTHRQTFSFNAEPYEVWYYYRIGRQYVFVDATGFGDYELTVPIWDERTRMR